MRIDWKQKENLSLDDCAETIKEYLFFTGSLTEKISNDSNNKFSLNVLSKLWQELSKEDALELDTTEKAFVREVLIFANSKPVIFAKTVIPAHTLTGNNKELQYLGNKSLGHILFTSENCYREEMQYAVLQSYEPLFQEICEHANLNISSEIYTRRSIFKLEEKPLLVLEAFLPNIATIKL